VRAAAAPGLRERKKAQTRLAIQKEALRLFLVKGYEATGVGEIAAAAGVSQMTFFRYFPTKEDVVIGDEYDPLLLATIASLPPTETPFARLRQAVAAGLARFYAADRESLFVRTRLILTTPALRARQWEQQTATRQMIARALASRSGQAADDLALNVVVAACLAAITAAAEVWVAGDGREELPELVDRAFASLGREIGASNG
jgi:AcrR family transcriptional regulator